MLPPSRISTLNQCLVLIFSYVFIASFIIGISTRPSEIDSVAYHIPLAEKIIDGTIFTNPVSSKADDLALYYPASSEYILALFVLMHIPLNLFNVIGLLVLLYSLFNLGTTFKLNKEKSLTFALSVATLAGFTRWLPTQIIDIWLSIFFIWALILLEDMNKNTRNYFQLGIALGFLIGSKISGILFFLALLPFYRKRITKNLVSKKGFVLVSSILIVGLPWYIRNYFLTNNPFFPLDFLFLQGAENDVFYDSSLLITLISDPRNMYQFTNALVSEYVMWGLIPFLLFIYLMKHVISKQKLSVDISRLMCIGFLNLLVFIILPAWENNIISSFRYSYNAFIPLVLAWFLIDEFASIIPIMSLSSAMVSLQLLPHQPKVAVLAFVINVVMMFGYKILNKIKNQKLHFG